MVRKRVVDGAYLRGVAEKLGLAQEDVARRLKASQSAVSNWYNWKPGEPRGPHDRVVHIFTCPYCRKHYLEHAALLDE